MEDTEFKAMQEQVKLLTEAVTRLLKAQEAAKAAPQAPQTPPQQPQPLMPLQAQNDAFSQLRGLIGAFKELRSYDNEVISGYRAIKQEIAAEMPEFEEGEGAEPESVEDYAAKMLLSRLGQPQQAQPVQAAPVSSAAQETVEGENMKLSVEAKKELQGIAPEFMQLVAAKRKEGKLSDETVKELTAVLKDVTS